MKQQNIQSFYTLYEHVSHQHTHFFSDFVLNLFS